ncbi:unnamed protein product [Clonostachys chloroleuca]|uniref:NmrA-like domain-containing protein n=1 Tax=Clonostachys chloroleuca TaxID=1926264 RepID=A0AA35M5Y6_9HYPO|nr:unnamed protein product [Clonostachys chloroleuca]
MSPGNMFKLALFGATAREATSSKPAYSKLRAEGIEVVAVDLDLPDADIARRLQGQDIVIASVPPNALEGQLPLIRAARLANVKRFVPSSFAMAIAAGGVCGVQDAKEKVYTTLAASGVPYTIIDVGWWYNGFIPVLPSGRTASVIAAPEFIKNLVPGDGTMKTHVIDQDDLGKIVALAIVDPRTLNQRVMASSVALSFNEIFGIVESLTGEKPARKYVSFLSTVIPRFPDSLQVSAQELQQMIAEYKTISQRNPQDYLAFVRATWLEYYYSSFINGDNSPEGVRRLGYLVATDLYPDFEAGSFETFLSETLNNQRRVPYSDRF